MDRDVGPVIDQQLAVQRADLVSRRNTSGDRQRALQHLPCAAADQVADLLDRDGRTARHRQRVVERGAEIAMGVEQCAVEVEADDAEGKIGHRGAVTQSGGNRNRRTWKPQ